MRPLAVLPLALLALLAGAAPASAVIYCVPTVAAACQGVGGSPTAAATIQAAFDAAEASAADDVVRIASGEFAPGTYEPLGAAKGTLEVIGSGVAATTVTGNEQQDALKIRRDTTHNATTVRNLRLVAGQTASGISTYGTVRDVVVNAKLLADRTTGITLYNGKARAIDVVIDLAEVTENSNQTGIHVGGDDEVSDTAKVTGATIVADQGMDIRYPTTVTHARIDTRDRGGISLYCAQAFVDNSVVEVETPGSWPIFVANSICDGQANTLMRIRQSTIVGGDNVNNPSAIRFQGSNGLNQVELRNSIVSGASSLSYGLEASAVLKVSNTLMNTKAVESVSLQDEGGNVVGDALFRDPAAGDFSLRWPSPAIDAGSTEPLAADEPTFDSRGAPRIADGDGDGVARRDMGAYEYHGPAAKVTATPATANIGQVVAFDASASTSHDAPNTFAWAFGDGGTAGNDPTVEHAFAAAGTYAVAVTVTDEQGRTATQTVSVTVVDPNAKPPGGGGTPGPAGPGPGVTPPLLDSTRPVLSGVRWTRARFRARTGSRLRWTLSEAAKLTVGFERCVKRRGKRCTKWRRVATVTRQAPAGAGSLKVARTVGRKALRKGIWRVRLKALDAAGNQSFTRIAGFTVR